MPEQHHIVKRQVLELAVARDQDTHRLHEAVSRICRSRLMPILDKHCSGLSGTDVIHRIDTLELDLGKIPLERLEEALSESFEQVLGMKLAKAIAAGQAPGEPGVSVSGLAPDLRSKGQRGTATVQTAETMAGEVQANVASQLELLAYYVNTGTLPWWADISRASLLRDNLKLLVEQAPSPLRQATREFSRDDRALRRMALTYDDSLLELLLGVLVPALQPTLRRFAPTLAEILTKTNAARDWTRSRVRNLVWEDVLRLAGTGDVERISSAEFSRAILQRLARQFGVGWQLFAEDIHRTLAARSLEDYPWLADLAASLQQDAAATAEPDTLRDFVPELVALLATTNATRARTRDQVRELVWEEALRLADVRNAGRMDPAEFSRAILEQLARQFGVAYRSLADDVSRALAARAPSAHPWLSKLAALLPQELSDHRLAPIPGKDAPGIDLRFSDSDEVYVNNAGLVILWPFLEHFFKHVGLIEEEAFKDDAARQRAAGLLQYVASEDASPPEYLLTLNKVLCGLDVEEVFDFGAPITELEIEECDNLLTAVIAQAPILHDMSLPAFRGTFLLRQGQLSARDGAWLLRVERVTYDVVLDRFPWTMKWVRLPWMAAPIQVEW